MCNLIDVITEIARLENVLLFVEIFRCQEKLLNLKE